MGIIGYIKRERERRFRFKVAKELFGSEPARNDAIIRYIDGDNDAFKALPGYEEYLDWVNELGWDAQLSVRDALRRSREARRKAMSAQYKTSRS